MPGKRKVPSAQEADIEEGEGEEITFTIVVYEDGSWSDLKIHSNKGLRNKQISIQLSIEDLDE